MKRCTHHRVAYFPALCVVTHIPVDTRAHLIDTFVQTGAFHPIAQRFAGRLVAIETIDTAAHPIFAYVPRTTPRDVT